jgi:hypothetical protein
VDIPTAAFTDCCTRLALAVREAAAPPLRLPLLGTVTVAKPSLWSALDTGTRADVRAPDCAGAFSLLLSLSGASAGVSLGDDADVGDAIAALDARTGVRDTAADVTGTWALELGTAAEGVGTTAGALDAAAEETGAAAEDTGATAEETGAAALDGCGLADDALSGVPLGGAAAPSQFA